VIFDDEGLFRRVLWIFFDERGYEVFTFPYPDLCPLHLALECPCPLGTSCSDIIISDVNMLGNNGIDFIEKLIKKGCKQRHFALMSGDFTNGDRDRAARLGCAADCAADMVFDAAHDLVVNTASVTVLAPANAVDMDLKKGLQLPARLERLPCHLFPAEGDRQVHRGLLAIEG